MQVHLVPPSAITGKTLFLDGAEAKHILKVRRLGVGDAITFTDGTGRLLDAVIDRCTPSELHAVVEEIREDPREAQAPWCTLAIALLKGDHFELALEKAVELGTHRIVPLLAHRCVVKLKPNQVEKRLVRWRRIADAAMKQSGRAWRPEVTEPRTVEQLIQHAGDATLIVGDEEETARTLGSLAWRRPSPVIAVVGPEGALTPEEKQALADAGGHGIRLSAYTLRAETAAVALVSALHGVETGS